ncbi:SulP family inorganic anion transporter [Dactylosporangium sp. NPDC000244]|uniref:SulP family inorganic anion transporter n=1 Tax=Dactylosporangium sp. NPDC000244 TaxID=3154365 RepID=UPI00331DD074
MPRLRALSPADLRASVVVFLVALPLCVGVAIASGVPAEVGLVTGIVGALVAGMLPGSRLQVSGPAAGLTVLVAEAVDAYGIAALGVLVTAAGLLQVALGALRLGQWFRAISVAVVEGMLAGIGLLLIVGQVYTMSAVAAPASGHGKLLHLPGVPGHALLPAVAVEAGTIAVLAVWPRMPATVRRVPGPLAAVVLAAAVVSAAGLRVPMVEVEGLLQAVHLPEFGNVGEHGLALAGTVVALTLIASAESLFCAAAVDRMHDGPRTDYDRELVAQGAGNTVCGLLGALPMTAVVVRSAANVQAGARTRASRVLHGVWLLLFAALLPAVLGLIPVAALSGVLIHAGWRLLPMGQLARLWRTHRGEAWILIVTAGAILAVNMFEGVLIGLALAIAKTAWETSHLQVTVGRGARDPEAVRVVLSGNATFLRLPKLLRTLDSVPEGRAVEVDLSAVHHLDHACRSALSEWSERRGAELPPEKSRASMSRIG